MVPQEVAVDWLYPAASPPGAPPISYTASPPRTIVNMVLDMENVCFINVL